MFKKITTLVLSMLCIAQINQAQIFGNGKAGSAPAHEVQPSKITDGALSNNVNLFNGSLQTGMNLGSVSTTGGVSFPVNLSYNSSFTSGNLTPILSGMPYGQGWNIDLPMITCSTEDLNKYNEHEIKALSYNSAPPYDRRWCDEGSNGFNDEGQLTWFAPKINIPGIASGRLVYKYYRQGNHHFTLHEYEQYIQAEFNGSEWKITIPDGTVYKFSGFISVRGASNQRMEPTCYNNLSGGGSTAIGNSILPRKEIVKWYCISIVNPNKIGRINFEYDGYGKFNFQEVYNQEAIWREISENIYGYTDGYGFIKPKLKGVYSDIYLKAITSSKEKMVFEYENLNPSTYPKNNSIINKNGPDGINTIDDLYSSKIIYTRGGASATKFNNWWRYHHSCAPPTNTPFGLPLYGTNPYISNLFSDLGYLRSPIQGTKLSFEHGFLESERLNDYELNIPGELYQITTEIETDSQLKFGTLFDINLATGEANNSNQTYLNKIEYDQTRGRNVFSTFNNAIKWYDKGKNSNNYGTLKTSNFYTHNGLPKENGGFYIQIGPANSDINYSTDLAIISQESGNPFMRKGYINEQDFAGGVHKKLSLLQSSASMPNNFGMGTPWSMVAELYGRVNVSADIFNPDIAQFWLNYQDSGPYTWKNRPTTTRKEIGINLYADTHLKKVEVTRYGKTPLTLKIVKKQILEHINELVNSPAILDQFETIKKWGFEYDFIATPRSLLIKDPNFNYDNEPLAPSHSVILKRVFEFPRPFTKGQSFKPSNPSYHFEYENWGNEGSLIINQDHPLFTSIGPSLYWQHYVLNKQSPVIRKITTPLGKTKEFKYYNHSEHKHLFNPIYQEVISLQDWEANLYSSGKSLAENNVHEIHPVIKEVHVLRENSTKSKINYNYNNLKIHESGTPIVKSSKENYSFSYSSGYQNVTVRNFPNSQIKSSTKSETEFYTNEQRDRFFGKIKSIKSYDIENNKISESHSYYEALCTSESPTLRLDIDNQGSDYYDYRFLNDRPYREDPIFTTDEEYLNALESYFAELTGDWFNLEPELPECLCENSNGIIIDDLLTALNISPFSQELVDCVKDHYAEMVQYNVDYENWQDIQPDIPIFHPKNPDMDVSVALWNAPEWYENRYSYYILNNKTDYLNSYFIKKIKDVQKTYEFSCTENENQLLNEKVINYEYYDANYRGVTTSTGFDKFFSIPLCSNDKGEKVVHHEPSYLLYKTTIQDSNLPNQKVEQENFYAYDLINDKTYFKWSECNKVFLNSAEHDLIDYTKFGFFDEIYKTHKLRNSLIETRTTNSKGNETVVSSTYYEYATDFDETDPDYIHYDIKEVFGGDDCDTDTNGFPNDQNANGIVFNGNHLACIYYTKNVSPGNPFFCNHGPTGSGYLWCTCMVGDNNGSESQNANPNQITTPSLPDPLIGYDPIDEALFFDPYDAPNIDERPPFILQGKMLPKAVYSSVSNNLDPNISKIRLQAGYNLVLDFNPNNKVIKTRNITHRDRHSFIVQTVDQNNIITRYDYPIPERVSFKYCDNGIIKFRSLIKNRNVGYPSRVTVGYGRLDAQFQDFTYYPNSQIKSVTDQNGLELSYTYDEFNRLIETKRNGVRISENLYSTWGNNFSHTFLQRGLMNFNNEKIFTSPTSFLNTRSYIDPLGRPMGNVTNGIIFGSTFYDGYNRPIVAKKPYHGFLPDFNIPSSINDKMETSYDIAPRQRPLKSSKFGNDVNGSKVVSNEYCLISAAELTSMLNTADQSATPLGTLFNSTKVKDEDGKWSKTITNVLGQTVATLTNNEHYATVFFYDALGNVSKVINPEGQEIEYFYNHLGQLYKKSNPDQQDSKYAYDKNGNLIVEYNPTGYLTVHRYDDYNRKFAQYRIDSAIPNHPIFANKGLFWLDSGSLATYESLLSSSTAKKEKEWKFDNYSNSTYNLLSAIGKLYLVESFENARGKVAEVISYNAQGLDIERKVFSYTEDGFMKWEIINFNYNGLNVRTDGQETRIDYADYDLQGNLLVKNVDLLDDRVLDIRYSYSYDEFIRLAEINTQFLSNVSANQSQTVAYKYDDISGQVIKKIYYDADGQCNSEYFDQVNYSYDHQFRLTSKNSNAFKYNLSYDDKNFPTYTDGLSNNWNGNINTAYASVNTAAFDNNYLLPQESLIYNYRYDKNNRLTNAYLGKQSSGQSPNNSAWGHTQYQYDKIGNITTLQRGERDENDIFFTRKLIYNYQNNSRLGSISHCSLGNMFPDPNFNCTSPSKPYTYFNYDHGGNLIGDSKNGILGVNYHRYNLPYRIQQLPNPRQRSRTIDYLYNENDARIFKWVGARSAAVTNMEYYLRDITGDELAIFDLLENKWTWYVNGNEREAKISILGRRSSGGGSEGPIKGGPIRKMALAQYSSDAQMEKFRAQNTPVFNYLTSLTKDANGDFNGLLYDVKYRNEDTALITPTQLAALGDQVEILETINIRSGTQRFDTKSQTATTIVSLNEILGLTDGFTPILSPKGDGIPPGTDPFTVPLRNNPNPPLIKKSFYLYDYTKLFESE